MEAWEGLGAMDNPVQMAVPEAQIDRPRAMVCAWRPEFRHGPGMGYAESTPK